MCVLCIKTCLENENNQPAIVPSDWYYYVNIQKIMIELSILSIILFLEIFEITPGYALLLHQIRTQTNSCGTGIFRFNDVNEVQNIKEKLDKFDSEFLFGDTMDEPISAPQCHINLQLFPKSVQLHIKSFTCKYTREYHIWFGSIFETMVQGPLHGSPPFIKKSLAATVIHASF
jgi:hypothetical protein